MRRGPNDGGAQPGQPPAGTVVEERKKTPRTRRDGYGAGQVAIANTLAFLADIGIIRVDGEDSRIFSLVNAGAS